MAQAITRHEAFGLSMAQALGVALLVWGLALALVLLLSEGVWRTGYLVGVVSAGLGGVVGFALLQLALGKSVQALLAARSVGFMLRALLVGVGLVVTLRVLGGEPLAFAFSFFPLFFVFSGLEHLVAGKQTAPARTQAPGSDTPLAG